MIEDLMMKYKFASETLMTQIKILIEEYEYVNKRNAVEHIKYRLKTIESIKSKLEKKELDFSTYNIINNINDVIGIRIVCSFLSDVYKMVDIIKNSRQFEIVSEKDYIKNPKSTGYTSYHMIILVPLYLNDNVEFVKAEIQIRTVAMDFWASLDHKIQYKFDGEFPDDIEKELANCSLEIRSIDDKMQKISDIINK